MQNMRSLKSAIVYRLVVPLLFFMAAETVISYFVTLRYVNQAYDRWLLDSAHSLTQEVKVREGNLQVVLPNAALEIFKWDDIDQTFFKIISENHGVLAGDSFVPEPLTTNTDWAQPVFFNDYVHEKPVRIVSMLIQRHGLPEKVFVHVAETLNKRHGMMLDILLADLLPQIFVTLLTGFYLFRGLNGGLKPLRQLTDEIARRSPRDLSPIPENQVLLEVRTLTDTINSLLQRLQDSIAAQQRFISNAAHQLRTPLAGLKLQAERALRENDLAAMEPALQQVQQSADRMSHLVSQLLVLAKSETGRGDKQLQALDFGLLARNLCQQWGPKILAHHKEFSFEGPNEAMFIPGDKILLGELLANLLDNAMAYGRDHGLIAVKVLAKPTPALIVEDDGPGIPQSERDKIFERFYRIQGTSGNGSGLGLAIVKEIVDLHGANIYIENLNTTGGTRITIMFNHLAP